MQGAPAGCRDFESLAAAVVGVSRPGDEAALNQTLNHRRHGTLVCEGTRGDVIDRRAGRLCNLLQREQLGGTETGSSFASTRTGAKRLNHPTERVEHVSDVVCMRSRGRAGSRTGSSPKCHASILGHCRADARAHATRVHAAGFSAIVKYMGCHTL